LCDELELLLKAFEATVRSGGEHKDMVKGPQAELQSWFSQHCLGGMFGEVRLERRRGTAVVPTRSSSGSSPMRIVALFGGSLAMIVEEDDVEGEKFGELRIERSYDASGHCKFTPSKTAVAV
jgi:hypothetical protein